MIKSVQYNAALAITGAIRGSSREKLYQELGFESLRDRRWYRKLCFYYKIRHNDCPLYLTEYIPIFEPSILPPLKFLNEHYLNLFVLSQH